MTCCSDPNPLTTSSGEYTRFRLIHRSDEPSFSLVRVSLVLLGRKQSGLFRSRIDVLADDHPDAAYFEKISPVAKRTAGAVPHSLIPCQAIR